MTVVLLLLYSVYRNYSFKKNGNLLLQMKNYLLQREREEAVHLKSQFVSTISHELRTLYTCCWDTNMLLDEHKELADSPHLNSLKFSALIYCRLLTMFFKSIK
jgi:signal transduction histidine kinase